MRPGGGKSFGGDTFDLRSGASGQREPRQQRNGIATEPGRPPGAVLFECPLLVGLHPSQSGAMFERQWLVNLILWGNYARLRDAVLDEMGDSLPGARCRSHAYTAYWSQLPSQDNVLRRPLPESGDHTLNQQRYRLSFTRTLVASGPVSPTSSL